MDGVHITKKQRIITVDSSDSENDGRDDRDEGEKQNEDEQKDDYSHFVNVFDVEDDKEYLEERKGKDSTPTPMNVQHQIDEMTNNATESVLLIALLYFH